MREKALGSPGFLSDVLGYWSQTHDLLTIYDLKLEEKFKDSDKKKEEEERVLKIIKGILFSTSLRYFTNLEKPSLWEKGVRILESLGKMATISQDIFAPGLIHLESVTDPTQLIRKIAFELSRAFSQFLFFPYVYRFRINPFSQNWTYTKLQRYTPFGFGNFQLQYFGTDMPRFSIEGITGACVSILACVGIRDLRLSIPYFLLKLLEDFYLKTEQALKICFLGETFTGFLDSLSFSHRAETFAKINFKMDFRVHPNRRYRIFGDDLGKVYETYKLEWLNSVSNKFLVPKR